MVQAIVNLSERENRVVQIVKGKYGIRTKAKAISFIIDQYEEILLEPELRPEYIEKIRRIEREESIKHYDDLESLRKDLEDA